LFLIHSQIRKEKEEEIRRLQDDQATFAKIKLEKDLALKEAERRANLTHMKYAWERLSHFFINIFVVLWNDLQERM
jgi:hypothetical protein